MNFGCRLDRDLHRRLREVAAERGVSANFLLEKAVADYLDRLVPLEDLLATEDEGDR